MSLKIAIQGIESSFHHLAVQQLFPDKNIELVPCTSFDKVAENISCMNVDLGVIAIENTIAGSILPNYQLIDSCNLKILEETFLTINMYLMALNGTTLHDIDEVHSHPVALQQCKQYLKRLQPHCKIIEGKDTASEARRIKENNLKGVAAIAGKQVAEKFGLEILGKNIQTIKENKTRFVVIGRETPLTTSKLNKATLKFQLDHNIGSLSNVLQLLSTFGINLTKIQSFPIEGKPWQYSFYVDVLFDNTTLFEEVTILLRKAVSQLRILGIYKQNLENAPSTLAQIPSYEKY
ncbi:prephenate dehydratase [Rasiella rasia]|uniref:prephenate dehydratase n=1 Tax=Rasiella rasia TaxID=2744027 RepID=A0A6G6GPG0_9FLAO|nr:prephenate dehydratase [Rasiella rasia]QIE60364.1 prephenate dehydratase [Rasiella rasia]